MEHEFKTKRFAKRTFALCSCLSFIRICHNEEEFKTARECWAVHKWAWQEEAKREELGD